MLYHRDEIFCRQLSRNGECLRVLEWKVLVLLADQLEEVLRMANHFTYHRDLLVASAAVTPIVTALPLQ